MMKPKWYWCATFRFNIDFFIGWKYSDFLSYAQKNYGYEDMGETGGKTLLIENGSIWRIALWTPPLKKRIHKYPVLAHEITHAAIIALNKVGVIPEWHNDEPLAYLVHELYQAALDK